MFYRLPDCLFRMYKKSGARALLYTIIKWGLTPFEEMERHVPGQGLVLDLGCGNGLFSNYLAVRSPDRKVVGIDSSGARINTAQSVARDNGYTNISFCRRDVQGFNVSLCKCVILSDFLHHISYADQEDLVKRSFTGLEKGGVIIIKEIDRRPRHKFIFSFIVDYLLNIGSNLYHRDTVDFQRMLAEIGFTDISAIPLSRHLPFSNVLYIGRKP